MHVEYDHISITVSDVDKSIAFYNKYFDFELVRRDKPMSGAIVDVLTGITGAEVIPVFMTNGNLVLEFMQYTTHKHEGPVVKANQLGSPHIAFVVDNVVEAHKMLTADGVKCCAPPYFNPRRQNYSVMMQDPDGIYIELRETAALKSVPMD